MECTPVRRDGGVNLFRRGMQSGKSGWGSRDDGEVGDNLAAEERHDCDNRSAMEYNQENTLARKRRNESWLMWESSSWRKPRQSWDSTGWMDTTSRQDTGLSRHSSTDVLAWGSESVCEPSLSWECRQWKEAQTSQALGSSSKGCNCVVAVQEETDKESIPEQFPFLEWCIPATLDFDIESDRFSKTTRRSIQCDGCPTIVKYHDSMCRYLVQFLHRSMMRGHSYKD